MVILTQVSKQLLSFKIEAVKKIPKSITVYVERYYGFHNSQGIGFTLSSDKSEIGFLNINSDYNLKKLHVVFFIQTSPKNEL